jgi:hypothetical protein
MKRQLLALTIGSLVALPAFADGEIGSDFWTQVARQSTVSREQVRAELVAAKAARGVVVDGEIGNTAPVAAATQKSRREVIAEIEGQRAIDGETGDPLPHA